MKWSFKRSLAAAVAASCCLIGVSTASAQPTNPTGACCTRSSTGTVTCTVGTFTSCRQARGHFRGANTTCDPNPCVPPPPPTGACCTRDAAGAPVCTVGTAAACHTARGHFRGPNSTCEPNPCVPPPPPTGACCTTDDDGAPVCTVGTLAACREAEGRFRGRNSVCDPNPCVPPTGACCARDDKGNTACAISTARTCRGSFRGANTACDPNPCPPPPPPPPARGACCVPATATAGPQCFVGTAARCTDAGGTYGGDRATCRSANCPTTCACDWDHDGFLSVRDLFSFLHDYMSGDADYNGDDATTDADLNAFMACFTAPPDTCTRRGPG